MGGGYLVGGRVVVWGIGRVLQYPLNICLALKNPDLHSNKVQLTSRLEKHWILIVFVFLMIFCFFLLTTLHDLAIFINCTYFLQLVVTMLMLVRALL